MGAPPGPLGLGEIAGGRLIEVNSPAHFGGRQHQRARVRWQDHEELTDSPTALVARLSQQFGGEVPGLQVLRPSLEDIYLEMIGGRS